MAAGWTGQARAQMPVPTSSCLLREKSPPGASTFEVPMFNMSNSVLTGPQGTRLSDRKFMSWPTA